MIAPGLTIPDECGRWYSVVRELGEGGQGKVFLAIECATQIQRIVKVYHSFVANPATAARLAALVRLNLSARSGAICAPYAKFPPQCGVASVQPMAMGESLEAVFQAPTYTLTEALGIAAAFCRALAVLEELGVAHGDIAASNLMVADVGPNYVVSTIDFDNALIPGAPAPTFRGQDLYAAPELLAGTASVSLESDRYSLAVLLHEILFLRHPFAGACGANGMDFSAYVALLATRGWPDDPAQGGPPPIDGLPVGVLAREIHALFRGALQLKPALRPAAKVWVAALEAALSQIYACGACGGLSQNEMARSHCPHCGEAPGPLALHVGGRVLPLDRMATTIGRQELGGNPTLSRAHVVIRRWGFGLRVRNTSLNGIALRLRSGWIELPANAEVDVAPGDQIRFAPGIEGVVGVDHA